MSTVKAPYNFVPLSKTVVIPEWANHINHDVPFKDAKSGKLDLTIKTFTPIFVRNSNLHLQKEENTDTDFSNFKNRCFIPGSSIKGAVENVLSIMTFSEMDFGVDITFAYRDLSLSMKDKYTKEMKPKDIRCGWLTIKDGAWQIDDHGLPARVFHEDIPRFPYSFFRSANTGKEDGQFNSNRQEHKSAHFKMRKFDEAHGNYNVNYSTSENKNGILIADLKGKVKKGQLVFTGQPGTNDPPVEGKKNGGKRLEFIFQDQRVTTYHIDNETKQNFLFAYYDHDIYQQQEDWKKYKIKLNAGKTIPVFFRTQRVISDGKEIVKLRDFGLAYLYKATYNNSLKDLCSQSNSGQIDFKKAIFGYVKGQTSLKGRVQFGHAFNSKECRPLIEQNPTLSSPKPTYYPTYLEQKGNKILSYDDSEARIAGWKRYPIRNEVTTNDSGTGATRTAFIPIEKGAEFSLTIAYHNLHPLELGALVSALTFHATTDCFHSVGMAKPLGYGRIQFEISDFERYLPYLEKFEAYMDCRLKTPWHSHESIRELATMACLPSLEVEQELKYMKLKPDNEFILVKNGSVGLSRYSKISNQRILESWLKQDVRVKYYNEFSSYLNLYKDLKFDKELVKQQTKQRVAREVDQYKVDLLSRTSAFIGQLKEKENENAKKQAEIDLEKNRQELAKIAQGSTFEISINPAHRDAFNDLIKAVRKRVENYNKDQDVWKYDSLVEKMPNGILPEQDREIVETVVNEIKANLKGKPLNEWKKTPIEQNGVFRKLKEWFGADMAVELIGIKNIS